jgi:hypothetical protein
MGDCRAPRTVTVYDLAPSPKVIAAELAVLNDAVTADQQQPARTPLCVESSAPVRDLGL